MKTFRRVGLLVNPIAGMGGKVGLKGTDGVLKEAINRGALPIAPKKTVESLIALKKECKNQTSIHWTCPSGPMGEEELVKAGVGEFEIVSQPKKETTAGDTQQTCKKFMERGVELILFCGGDGTARDIYSTVGQKVLLLGIPSGVKMHSGVFGTTASAVAKILAEWIEGKLRVGDAEIMDVDEDAYRMGKWQIKLFGVAKSLIEPTFLQAGKLMVSEVADDEIKDEIADYLVDKINEKPRALWVLGSGSTVEKLKRKLGIKPTLLGIDAFANKKQVGKDLAEKEILELMSDFSKVKVVLSPIGAQGFILGRGNLQLSPKIIKRVGVENLEVVATPSKLTFTPVLRVDTGDRELDKQFSTKGYLLVTIGYRLMRLVPIGSS
ncbi:MAG TPA: ATP-NAD kinase family protein [Thermoplasmata archaeon]|nr:ATP-NAD kinase family protein [Thermoplasmata archaeon]HIH98341.1 ATP-NAD kinase family protein [Thermoplasmata archaeon]